jgi:hypothetical protein
VLIGASGLFVPGSHISDIFLNSNPDRGTDLSSLRRILFASAHSPMGLRYYPDGKGDLEEEMRRYAMLRFEINLRSASVIGFVGAGGIGEELYKVISFNYYEEISAIILLVILAVVCIDLASEALRRRVIEAVS